MPEVTERLCLRDVLRFEAANLTVRFGFSRGMLQDFKEMMKGSSIVIYSWVNFNEPELLLRLHRFLDGRFNVNYCILHYVAKVYLFNIGGIYIYMF